MARSVVRLAIQLISTWFGALLLVFLLFNVLPGDPAESVLGSHASAQSIQEMRKVLGLDASLPEQFLVYCRRIVGGDLGKSLQTGEPVGEMLWNRMGHSLGLALPSFLLSVFFACLLGLWSAQRKGRSVDRALLLLSFLFTAVPSVLLILGLQYVLGYKLAWFPLLGWSPLPVFIWVVLTVPDDARYFGSLFSKETSSPYVWAARLRGISEWRIQVFHVLRNSLAGILAWMADRLAVLYLGSFLIESFFQIPGLGSLTVDAFVSNDFPTMRALTLLHGTSYVVLQWSIDRLQEMGDPRLISRGAGRVD